MFSRKTVRAVGRNKQKYTYPKSLVTKAETFINCGMLVVQYLEVISTIDSHFVLVEIESSTS